VEKILLILILILQVIFSGIVFAGNESSFNWDAVFSLIQVIVVICGFFWGYHLLKREISFKKRLEVHEKLTDILVKEVHESFYLLGALTSNHFSLENSNPRNKDDHQTNSLKDTSERLMKEKSNFDERFQKFSELFQCWKFLFSEKIERESKFLVDLKYIYSEDLRDYWEKLMEYSKMSLLKDDSVIAEEKKVLCNLEKKLSNKNIVLANGLDKFVADISRATFGVLLASQKDGGNRLFDLELENANDGDPMVILTEKGFVRQPYKKTRFQVEFGGFKERQQALREFLEK
jgi:hypothetical protein